MKKVFLYIMVFVYLASGIYHFVNLSFYDAVMPIWVPNHALINSAAGLSEIVLATLLLFAKTRKVSAYLIVCMLLVFLLVIHVPMTIDYYENNHPSFWISTVRLPIQILLIWWAWVYTKPLKPN